MKDKILDIIEEYTHHGFDGYVESEKVADKTLELINTIVSDWAKSVEAFEPINGGLYFTQKQVFDLLDKLK